MKAERIFTAEDSGNFALNHECLLCGCEFTNVVPRDYYTDEWHNFFGCCTHNCLEDYFNYDSFREEFISAESIFDFKAAWKEWCKQIAIEKGSRLESPEELFNSYKKEIDYHILNHTQA